VFVVRESLAEAFSLHSLLPSITSYQPTKIITFAGETMGAAETLLLAKEFISKTSPMLICDETIFTEWGSKNQSVDELLDIDADAAVAVFHDDDPRWSYVQVVPDTLHVTGVCRGQVISNTACSGVYYWKRSTDFIRFAESALSLTRTKENSYVSAVYAQAVGSPGFEVKAFFPYNSIMLRSEQAIKDFEKQHAFKSVPEKLNDTYIELIARQTSSVLRNGVSYDNILVNGTPDSRRCHAVYRLCTSDNWAPTSAFAQFMIDVRSTVGNTHVFYGINRSDLSSQDEGNLHLTLLQLIGFDQFSETKVPQNYHDTISAVVASHVNGFSVVFHSVALTPKSLMLLGTPNIDLNHVRDLIRSDLCRLKLPMLEPYHSNTVHMTLVRFASEVSLLKAQELLRLTSKCYQCFFGTLTVKSFQVGCASWKMQHSELFPS
jgi:hypothetical protein